MKKNGKDNKIGLMKMLAATLTKDDQQTVLLLPAGGLTRCESLKVRYGGKVHTRE